MDALDRIINKLEGRKIDRALGDIILKLEGELIWTLDKKIECKGFDRDGQVVVECKGDN